MKTTISIADPLLEAARKLAAERSTTLREIVNHALSQFLEEQRDRPPFRLRDESVDGEGLADGLEEGDWGVVREAIYRGRGG